MQSKAKQEYKTLTSAFAAGQESVRANRDETRDCAL